MTHTIVKELSESEIRAVIADMREQAASKREQSRALHAANKHDLAHRLVSQAIVEEHWANRLERVLDAHP